MTGCPLESSVTTGGESCPPDELGNQRAPFLKKATIESYAQVFRVSSRPAKASRPGSANFPDSDSTEKTCAALGGRMRWGKKSVWPSHQDADAKLRIHLARIRTVARTKAHQNDRCCGREHHGQQSPSSSRGHLHRQAHGPFDQAGHERRLTSLLLKNVPAHSHSFRRKRLIQTVVQM